MTTLISAFFKKKRTSCLSSACPEILAFSCHCLAKFQPIFDYFIPNVKLKYEDSENIKTDRVYQIKQRNFFGTPGTVIRIAENKEK